MECSFFQQITGIPPEGLTSEEIEKMRKKFGVSFKFSKFVLNDSTAVSAIPSRLSLKSGMYHSISIFSLFL